MWLESRLLIYLLVIVAQSIRTDYWPLKFKIPKWHKEMKEFIHYTLSKRVYIGIRTPSLRKRA